MSECAVVLAAGLGTRLRPLTEHRPKLLCPIGHTTPLELALARLAQLGFTGPDHVAVNAYHLADQITAAVDGRAHVSVEPTLLGTAGAIAHLRDWIAGRAVVTCNGDAYLSGKLPPAFTAPPDDRVRLLTVPDPPRSDFGDLRFVGISRLPHHFVAALPTRTSDLYQQVWRDEYHAGRATLVEFDGTFFDCGTPADYLAANLHACGGASVIGAGAQVFGRLTRSVVWPGGYVGPDEHLVEAVRVGTETTVFATDTHSKETP